MGTTKIDAMDIKRINELVAKSSWTAMLKELPAGKHTLSFPNVNAIKSCKAIAYDMNSDNNGRKYRFFVEKKELSVTITVIEDE